MIVGLIARRIECPGGCSCSDPRHEAVIGQTVEILNHGLWDEISCMDCGYTHYDVKAIKFRLVSGEIWWAFASMVEICEGEFNSLEEAIDVLKTTLA